MRIALVTALLLLASILAAPSAPAAGGGGRAELGAPRAVPLEGGGSGAVAYTATVTAEGTVPTDTLLPTTATDVRGLGADGVDMGDAMAWLSPPDPAHFQFWPESTRLEHAYLTTVLLDASRANALEPGDHADIAVADLVGNALLPWDQPRAGTEGRLEMRPALDRSTITGTYAGATGQADVLIGRADIVAVGGDVDARAGTRRVSGTIDLGRTYPAGTPISAAGAVFLPFTSYVRNIDIVANPETGTLVLEADVAGYIPEAAEHHTRDGMAATWHLPVVVGITIGTGGSPVPTIGIDVPADGFAAVDGVDGPEVIEVTGGSTLLAAAGQAPVLVGPLGEVVPARARVAAPARAGGTTSPPPAPPVAERESVLANEWVGATRIHRDMAAPVEVRTGLGRLGFVVDPDHGGEGVLALTGVRDLPSGRTLAGTWTVPSAVVDGTRVPLDRSRLVDLRLFPQLAEIGVGFSGLSAPSPDLARVRQLFGWALQPAMHLVATYAVGEDRLLVVEYAALPPGEDLVPEVWAITYQMGLDGAARPQVSPVQVVELASAGLRYGGVPQAAEFARSISGGATLESDGVAVSALSPSSAPTDLRVVRRPASLTALPDVRPRPFGDRPAAAFHQSGMASGDTALSMAGPAGVLPPASPPQLGERCRPAEVTDDGLDAPPATDVREAWIDSEDAAVHASVRVADLPAAPPVGSTLTYRIAWRHEHRERWAEATLDSDGWTYASGPFPTRAVTGEVQPGRDGVVRITVPRSVERVLDGELLRDTSAQATMTTTAGRTTDTAQGGAGGYGLGGDHVIGAAC